MLGMLLASSMMSSNSGSRNYVFSAPPELAPIPADFRTGSGKSKGRAPHKTTGIAKAKRAAFKRRNIAANKAHH